MFRMFVVAALVVAVMMAIKDGRVLRETGPQGIVHRGRGAEGAARFLGGVPRRQARRPPEPHAELVHRPGRRGGSRVLALSDAARGGT